MKIRLETIEHFSTTVPLSSICFVEEEELEDLLVRELWKPELFKEYKTAKEAEMRAKMAESDSLVDNLDNNSVMVDPDPHSYRF